MKKILILCLVFILQNSAIAGSYIDKQLKETKKNVKYNTVKSHKRNYAKVELPQVNIKNTENLKDPKLIKLSDYKPVDEKLYKAKLANDELLYKNKIMPSLKKKTNTVNLEPEAVDFYNLYRISERLIRANNLGYVNWRVAVRKSQDFNASSFEGNYIMINTALYDTLYTSDDALAFVIGHEMSHLILGHGRRKEELNITLQQLKRNYKRSNDAIAMTGIAIRMRTIYNEMKMMEFMADTEALILLTRAGYSPQKALEALNFIESLSYMEYYFEEHPAAARRIESARENISYTNPDWVNEGKANIYSSEVMPVKKSSDRVSFVISRSKKMDKFYEPETMEKRLARVAYMSYLNGNMTKSVKYFDKLGKMNDSYIPYLYLSYSLENLYAQTKEKKYLKYAKKAIDKACKINPTDVNVQKQINDMKAL